MNCEKEIFEIPTMEWIHLSTEDIIATSNNWGEWIPMSSNVSNADNAVYKP